MDANIDKQQALTDIGARLHIVEEKLKHNTHLRHDLDQSMQRLVEYMPVIESARQQVRQGDEELVEELRDLVLRTVVRPASVRPAPKHH